MNGSLALLSQAVQVVPADEIAAPLGPRIVFWALCALVLGGALVTITRRNLISAVMALVATFFGLAGLYALLFAHFLAAIQVLVYAGGIMVLFVFVIMVLNREEAEPVSWRYPITKGLGTAAVVFLTARLAQLLWAAGPRPGAGGAGYLLLRPEVPRADFGTVAAMGDVFFTDFLFAFEGISILLVIAVIGAVVLARTTVARATTLHELPAGEVDTRQPQHAAQDTLLGVPHHAPPGNVPGEHEGH